MSGRTVEVRAQVWRVQLDGTPVEDISDAVVAASVDLNIDREPYLAGQLVLRDPGRIAPLRDVLSLAVIYTTEDGAETAEPLGLYTTLTPAATSRQAVTEATYQLTDLTGVLATSVYLANNDVPQGTSVVTELSSTLSEAGITRTAFPASSRTFRKTWTFPAGTSRLEKCNRVLDHIAWYRLQMFRDGRVGSRGPYVDPARQEPFATWTDDDLLSAVDYRPSDAPPANVVIVIRDDPSEAPLIAVARNDDPNSRTSTVTVGREIVRVETVSGGDLHSQEDADALAARLLAESRQRYETVSFSVYPDARALDAFQTVRLAFTSAELLRYSGTWRIRTASLGTTPATAALQVELARVTFDGGGVAVRAVDAAVSAVLEAVERGAAAAGAFRATWRGTSGGLAKIRRLTESADDGESYAHVAGFAPAVGDEVLCVSIAGKPVVVGKLLRADPGTLALAWPLAVPGIRLTRPRLVLGARPNPGAASASAAGTSAWTLSGSASNADDATGPWLQLATTSTTGSAATLSSPALTRIDWATAAEPVELVLRLRLNQVDGLRFWCGLFSGDPSGSSTPNLSFVGFRYVAGSDADFRCYAGDGSVRSQVGSGVSPDTSAHEFRVVLAPAACTYWIDGVQVGTVTANLPASGANLACWVTVTNLASAARSFRFGGAAAVTP